LHVNCTPRALYVSPTSASCNTSVIIFGFRLMTVSIPRKYRVIITKNDQSTNRLEQNKNDDKR
jgi:hypothetical protein